MRTLAPRLAVHDAAAAIDFYVHAMGGKEISRFDSDGTIVHAEVAFGDHIVMVKDEDATDPSPTTLGGTPVLLSAEVDDVDDLGRRMTAAGAEVVFAIDDHGYGLRDGRFRDPFGHLWIIGTRG